MVDVLPLVYSVPKGCWISDQSSRDEKSPHTPTTNATFSSTTTNIANACAFLTYVSHPPEDNAKFVKKLETVQMTAANRY